MKINFTKATIAALPNPESGKRVTYYDTKVRGLTIRITSSGVRSFNVFRKINGKPERVFIGHYPDMAIERARRKAEEINGVFAEGGHPKGVNQAAKKQLTLQAVLDEYLTNKRLKPKTEKSYRDWVEKYLEDWVTLPVADITGAMVVTRHSEIGKKHGEAQANGVMRVLRAVYNYCLVVYEEIVALNPVARLSRTRAWYKVPRRQTLIRRHELAAWYKAVIEYPNELSRDYFLLLLFCGLRAQEGARVKVSDIDIKARTLAIPDTKSSEPLLLPLSDYLVKMLKARLEETQGEFLFPARSQSGHIAEPKSAAKSISDTAGVRFTPHDLRRTFTTTAESLDISPYALKRLLNHSTDDDVTAGYIVRNVERLRKPMQQITDALLAAIGSPVT